MWGGWAPTAEEAQTLVSCFEREWNDAILSVLRMWTSAPS